MKDKALMVRGLWIVLLLEYVFIFSVICNYHMASFSEEKFVSHKWILSNGHQWHWEDFGKFVNTEVIELCGDRLSRPVSNFVEVLNAKFRANCWNFIPPHPSFSLMWLLSFITLPFFLFNFFKNMGCAAPVAFTGTCWYIGSVGFLSPLNMLFHPAKSLVNFLGVLTLFMGSKFFAQFAQKSDGGVVRDIPHGWLYVAGFFSCLALALFSDETGLFIYVMAFFIFTPVFFGKLRECCFLIGAMLVLPVVYGAVVFWGLPWLHFWLYGHVNNLSHYGSLPRISHLFLPDLKNFQTNFYWLLGDHPHLRLDISSFLPYPHLFILQSLYTIALGLVMYAFVRNFNLRRIWNVSASVFLAIAFVFFHTFQLSNNARIWGVWWYGSLFSLVYCLLLTFILQHAWEGQKTHVLRRYLVLVTAIMVCHTLVFATYRINYFNVKSGPPGEGHPFIPADTRQYQHFSFLDSMQRSRCEYLYTVHQWAKAKNRIVANTPESDACIQALQKDDAFMRQSAYLSIEL